nr:MAG TPA: hypothetical protein [Caudoviricetes sp.]
MTIIAFALFAVGRMTRCNVMIMIIGVGQMI